MMAWLFGKRRPSQQVQERSRPTIVVRAFDAGRVDNITAGWSTAAVCADDDIRSNLDRMRARSRNMSQNNDHVVKYLSMVVANIVGPNGFTLQCRSAENGQQDRLANGLIEAAFDDWGQRGGCDITGQMSFVDLQSLVIRTVARDGEALVRHVRGRSAGNAYGYALQVLDIARLPTSLNSELSNGNRVVMGVELNAVGRPVAYHLTTSSRGANTYAISAGSRFERVPVDDLMHIYRSDMPEQRRGYPWAHSAMLRLEMLVKFEEAAVIAARKGAETLGFFETPDGLPTGIADTTAADAGSDTGADPIMTSVAGTFDTLPAGVQFRPFDTRYPDQVYGQFVKEVLRGAASGLNVAYNTFANDLEGVNFSSIRSGTLEERDQWMRQQTWFVSAFLRPVYLNWLLMALTNAAITYPTGAALPVSKIGKFSAHSWQGRRWAWVDPLKDVNANVAAINAGLKSRTQVAAEQGADLDDIWQQLKAEQQQAEALGLVLSNTSNATSPSSDVTA